MKESKPLVWLHGEFKTPPFTVKARVEAGLLLRRLQNGERIGLPFSRPMPIIGSGCQELRIQDTRQTWRVIYALEPEAVVILEVFSKKTTTTPPSVILVCRKRLKRYRKVVNNES